MIISNDQELSLLRCQLVTEDTTFPQRDLGADVRFFVKNEELPLKENHIDEFFTGNRVPGLKYCSNSEQMRYNSVNIRNKLYIDGLESTDCETQGVISFTNQGRIFKSL